MGVHTGDSITVAPALTLTDKEYQIMRSASLAVLREIGVETGGSNVQFAVNPEDGRMVVIEMNPRVSRSSALASKATGFPIAKVAAKLAVGYTLDEIANDITDGATPASFEPTIDYVVTKIPRFAFEKYPGADNRLSTSMKSVGEVMSMGRTFQESVQKALRSMETGLDGFDEVEIAGVDEAANEDARKEAVRAALSIATPDRLRVIAQAFREGLTVEEVRAASLYEPWFLRQIEALIHAEEDLATFGLPGDAETMRKLKAMGFSDARMAKLVKKEEAEVRKARRDLGVRPAFKRVDTCAAEFFAATPYMYSTYEAPAFGGEVDCESDPTDAKKAIILGGGPNRIGQGIEFDYCCCHAAFAFGDMGIESIMVNCNPETVSTDYDTADRLYFEPLTIEDTLELIAKEQEKGELLGVVVQYGGQTPLKLAGELEAEGVPILGTAPDAIDLAEDRWRFKDLLDRLNLKQPPNAIASSEEQARAEAEKLGFPLVLRPSYVLGGRAMEIIREIDSFDRYLREAVHVSGKSPLLLDRYLTDADEVDVDAICDGEDVWVAGVMQHIEEAGVHSGDSACSLPPYNLPQETIDELKAEAVAMAKAIGVKGLMNVQFAVKNGEIYVLEVNPRASRTVPFVAKAIGQPVAKIAAKVMAGAKLKEFGLKDPAPKHVSVKEAVMPWARFPGVDPVLGPEMRSTGEVMGIDTMFEGAFAKAELGAGVRLPRSGGVFISLKEGDKSAMVEPVRVLAMLGFKILATAGTATVFEDAGIPVTRVNKVFEGRPHIVDMMKNGEVQLIFNTTEGRQSHLDSYSIRRTALDMKIPCYTTASAARAAILSLRRIDDGALEPVALQTYS
jgi:carbamoyl-phosphate synthase large subunit